MGIKTFLLFLSAALFVPNLFETHLVKLNKSKSYFDITFDPSYARKIRSVNDLVKMVDSAQAVESIEKNSIEFAEVIDKIIFARFYFGYSYYSLKENWIAAVAGKLIWNNLDAIVIPDDILKYPMAACSQQSIVLMEMFRRYGIPYRAVGFDHHYALEAMINNKWYYFDPTLDPVFPRGKRTSLSAIFKEHRLKQLYLSRLNLNSIDTLLAHPTYSRINIKPAPRARLFHMITGLLSHWLWLLPLFCYIWLYLPKRFQWQSRFFTYPTTG